MTSLIWQDDHPKTTPPERIRLGLAAYARLFGRPAALVLVAPGEAAAVEGVVVREAKPQEGVVHKGTCWVSGGGE